MFEMNLEVHGCKRGMVNLDQLIILFMLICQMHDFAFLKTALSYITKIAIYGSLILTPPL